MKLNEIYIRDPFVLADPNSKMYYLYGTTPSYEGQGFYCFKSQDLVDWSGPIKVFTPPSDFWGTKDFWAPEVHMYRGEYYMFATFKGDNTCRGTQILHATSPEGPFNVHSDIITPSDWECLDGTFYVNETGSPYMIFCHEWLQINDGTICALELSENLKHRLGDPITLFKASDASWSKKPSWHEKDIYVTDGPFVFEREGKKFLLWSSYNETEYLIGVARPAKSFIDSHYIQANHPLAITSAGHGMIFTTFAGKDKLIVHVDNEKGGKEHPALFDIKIVNEDLEVVLNEN